MDFYTCWFDDLADKRVKDWPLMANPFLILGIAYIYYKIVTKWGPQFMKKRKPFNLTTFIKWYNIFQIIYSSGTFLIIGFNGFFTGELTLGCEPVDYSGNPKSMLHLKIVWCTIFLKLTELIETIIFVLRKKMNQVSVLHVYHHISTLLIVWCAAKYVGGGMTMFPIFLNSLVHAIMYVYYYFAAFGPEWQKRLSKYKNKLTLIQMIQFVLITVHVTQVYKADCRFPTFFIYFYIPNVILVFYMFYNFYRNAYTKQKQT